MGASPKIVLGFPSIMTVPSDLYHISCISHSLQFHPRQSQLLWQNRLYWPPGEPKQCSWNICSQILFREHGTLLDSPFNQFQIFDVFLYLIQDTRQLATMLVALFAAFLGQRFLWTVKFFCANSFFIIGIVLKFFRFLIKTPPLTFRCCCWW